MTIGLKIKQFREHYGLSQSDFANLIGITQAGLYKIEKGQSLPGYKIFIKIIKLAKKMKYQKLDLFFLDDED